MIYEQRISTIKLNKKIEKKNSIFRNVRLVVRNTFKIYYSENFNYKVMLD